MKFPRCVPALLLILPRLALQAQHSSLQLSRLHLLLRARQTCRPPLLLPPQHHQLQHQLQRRQLQHHRRPQPLAVIRRRPVKLVPMRYLTVQSLALSLLP